MSVFSRNSIPTPTAVELCDSRLSMTIPKGWQVNIIYQIDTPIADGVKHVFYGEKLAKNIEFEIAGVAFAVANRARVWDGKTIAEMHSTDPNYTFFISDDNDRCTQFMKASEEEIEKNVSIKTARNAAHNIFSIQEPPHEPIKYWHVFDKKTKKLVKSKERGRYSYVWVSTAAQGKTIFWKHDADYIKATGCKEYR